MTKTLLTFALAILPASLPASTADVTIGLAGTPFAAETGTLVPIRVQLENTGPDPADSPSFSVNVPAGFFEPLQIAGWNCQGAYTATMQCSSGIQMALGSLAFEVVLHAPNVPVAAHIHAWQSSLSTDPTSSANRDLNVVASAATADIAISSLVDPPGVERGKEFQFVSRVENHGPSSTGDITLLIEHSFPGSTIDLSPASPAWNCTRTGGLTACRSAGLAAGTSKELRYTVKAPDFFTHLSRNVRVFFRGAADPAPANNRTTDDVTVGILSNFSRILIPISIYPTDGAYGSRWTSELHVLGTTSHPFALFPTVLPCYFDPCLPNEPFGYPLLPEVDQIPEVLRSNTGVFVYTASEDELQVHFNLRVQDISRQSQTWGTEIPVVRESAVRTSRIELMNVPLDDRFRQTIRVYDFDARGDGRVVVRFLRGSGGINAVLAETILDLAVPADNHALTPLELPMYPGYAQLDGLPQRFPEIGGQEAITIEVEPVTPGLRYWAFASITNNETQHVTTVTPQ